MAASLAQDEELDASLYPIAVLLEELKNEDLQLRLNATRRLKTIAEALGPERTRGELLPFITDTIDDEDDVLIALSEELGSFVDHVGGPSHAHVLLQPLETLSTVEESLVRERAVSSICKLSAYVASVAPNEAHSLHVDHLFPLLQRLAMGDWFTSRISSCSLVAHVYQHLPPTPSELRHEVLSIYKRLARDETPMVRRAAASNISVVAKAVSLSAPYLIRTDLLSVFSTLGDDDQDSVRLLIVENSALFATLLSRIESGETTSTSASSPNDHPSAMSQTSNDTVMASGENSEGSENIVRPNADTTTAESQTSAEMGDAPDAPHTNGTAPSTEMTDATAANPSDRNATAPDTESGMSADPAAPQSAPTGNGPTHTRGDGKSLARIVEMIRAFASDKSWRVRYMVANQLPELCDALGAKATRSDLLPAYIMVLKDTEPEVRTAAAFKVSDLITKLVNLPSEPGADSGLDAAVQDVLPVVEQLVTDSAQHVRSALATNIMALAPVLGSEKTMEHLVDVVLSLLKDDCPEVRLNVIARLDKVSFVMSIERLSSELLPAIVELAEDKNWRVRLAIIERIALLATQLGKQFFEENGKLGDLCISWLGDCVFSIREAAIINLKKLTEIFGVDWAKAHIVPQILEMYDESSNYLLRMTALHAIGVLSQVVGVETVEDMFLPVVTDRASRDPVPNVRFCSAKTLNLVIPYVRHDVRESKIRPCLMTLVDANEKDTDVNYFAQQALIKLASSPCPS